ncbi:MAG: TonB-dependent receptor, partial [Schleiferiaceae bacterium]|nr:TonB-dependent receptor [Schleiferiaceae bacterium]
MRQITLFLAFLGFFIPSWAQSTVTVSGNISEASTGETLPSALVILQSKEGSFSANTNPYGFYSLTVPIGASYRLKVNLIGYALLEQNLGILSSNRKVDISLKEEATQLGEVNVVSQRLNANVTTTEMSVSSLSAKEIKKVPQLLGETDIIRTLTLLPGVSTVGEGASGFNVRGGNADQNLILLDEAPVYNSSHLFGFFSIFNADAVKDVKLYKGGMPANYGGRLSSVLDVRQKEGNSQKFSGTGGIGLLSSRLLLEGPIVKDKVNYMVAGRRSYFDLFFPLFDSPELDNTTIYFYDLNVKINAKVSDKDRIFLSSYFGRDQFGASDLFDFGWGNWTSTLRWNRLISPRLFFNATAVYSDYTYQLGTPKDADPAFIWDSRIQNYVTNLGWTWYANTAHTVDFGIQNTAYVFHPGQISGVFSLELQQEYATEPALYVSDDWRITDALTATYGLRYSTFFNLGGRDIQTYSNPLNPKEIEATGITTYAPGEVIASFTGLAGLEPRLALNYQLGPRSALKASYNRSRQYLHLISNNTTATPVNVWRPAGQFIQPATVDQVALGWAQNFGDQGIRLSLEGYYKKFQDLLDYKDGADLVFTEYIETQLLRGDGRAYGAEFLLEKKQGALTGWLG